MTRKHLHRRAISLFSECLSREAENCFSDLGQPRYARDSLAGLAFWDMLRVEDAPRQAPFSLLAVLNVKWADFLLRRVVVVVAAAAAGAAAVAPSSLTAILTASSSGV